MDTLLINLYLASTSFKAYPFEKTLQNFSEPSPPQTFSQVPDDLHLGISSLEFLPRLHDQIQTSPNLFCQLFFLTFRLARILYMILILFVAKVELRMHSPKLSANLTVKVVMFILYKSTIFPNFSKYSSVK